MKTFIILLIALFSIPSVSLAGTSGAEFSSLEEINPRREKTYSTWKHITKPRNHSEAKQQRSNNRLTTFLSRAIPGKNPRLGKTLSVVSIALGVLGILIMAFSLPLMTGLFFFLMGVYLTLSAFWLAIFSLILLDKREEKKYWRAGFWAMCLTLVPLVFVFFMTMFFALITRSTWISPADIFR